MISPYTTEMPAPRTKEGRFEFRPSAEALRIMSHHSQEKGVTRAAVLEMALRVYDIVEAKGGIGGIKRTPSGADIMHEASDDTYNAKADTDTGQG